MSNKNIPDCYRGDMFFVDNSKAVTGSEQGGSRPAIIISNDTGNLHSPTVEIVYLTSQEKNPLPTHVQVECKVPSTALCESVYTVSKERLGEFIRECTPEEMEQINRALLISIGISAPLPPNNPVEVELAVYKKLYEGLLDRLTARE